MLSDHTLYHAQYNTKKIPVVYSISPACSKVRIIIAERLDFLSTVPVPERPTVLWTL